jgi:DNA-binding MarR family transcriptional regulator
MPDSAAQPAAEPPPDPAQRREYALSEAEKPAQQSMLKRLSHWARQLKYGQFRLFLALAELAEDDEHHSVTIALRELCELAQISTSVFPQALKKLEEAKLVTVRHGGNRRQNAYQVNFFKTICASKFDAQKPLRASKSDAQAHLSSMHSASNFDAPPTEKSALARAAAASDFDVSTLMLIDHVNSAKAKSFDRKTIEAFRHWLHGYMAKCGRNPAGDRYADAGNPPHPPTDDQVAQVLAIADERTVTRALELLLTDGHEPMSYYWFVAVLMHRIHGITIEQRKKGAAILVDVKRQAKQKRVDAGELPDKQASEQMIMDLTAGVKQAGATTNGAGMVPGFSGPRPGSTPTEPPPPTAERLEEIERAAQAQEALNQKLG